MPLARLPVAHAGIVDDRHWLVVRRCLDAPDELAYYLVYAPPDTPLSIMVQAIGTRWHIEEDLQANKALGLDQYEVRSYQGWYRHITLVLLASAFLLSICVQQQAPPSASQGSTAASGIIALTPSEVRHLLAHLFFLAPTAAPFISGWSLFRRMHQYWAGYYHRRRRKTSRLSPCLEPISPSPENSWESSGEFSDISQAHCRAKLLGNVPGVRQASSCPCGTSYTKGVVPCPSSR